jgi:hypothetical protein
MKTAILTSTILSISLLTMSLSAGTNMICKDGVCILDLSTLSSDNEVKEVKRDENLFKVIKEIKTVDNHTDTEVIETIILAPEKYIMTVAEIEEYEASQIQLSIPSENINNKIIEKTTLPTSEYFCEKNKKAVYHQETDSYECA